MRQRARLAVVVLLGIAGLRAPRARAWDAAASRVPKRSIELQKARKAKKPDDVVVDVLARAKQKKPPEWIRKTAWKETYNGADYLFGVGIVQGIKNPALRVAAGEDRARASIARLSADTTIEETKDAAGNVTGRTVSSSSKAVLKNVLAVDWYADASDGSFYTLVVARP
jgi:hypothetical protein